MWGVFLTAGQSAHSSTELGHELSLLGVGGYLVYVTKVVTHGHEMSVPGVSLLDVVPTLAMRCLS